MAATENGGRRKQSKYPRGAKAAEAAACPLPSLPDDMRLDRDGAPCLLRRPSRMALIPMPRLSFSHSCRSGTHHLTPLPHPLPSQFHTKTHPLPFLCLISTHTSTTSYPAALLTRVQHPPLCHGQARCRGQEAAVLDLPAGGTGAAAAK